MDNSEVTLQPLPTAAVDRLHDYERLKLELASILRQMLALINSQRNSEGYRKCQELLARLADDRFTLAVVGQFSRGKSSLMNAILGMDRLPVGLVPLTSVITKVAYGNPERVIIQYAGSQLRTEARIDELPEYVTESGNPGNEKEIAAAEVQLPSDFLRRGLYFVDTPGVGSVITANTMTTEAFLPSADAVIFVTSFDSPLGREELEFLLKVREHVGKIFFVVNKSDLVSPSQREQVLAFLRNKLKAVLSLSEPRLFPVSALLGLRAKLTGSAEQLEQAGLPELEESLTEFLTSDKTLEFLLRTCKLAMSLGGELQTNSSSPNPPSENNLSLTKERKTTQDATHASFSELLDSLWEFRKSLVEKSLIKEQKNALPPRPHQGIPDAELMEATRQPCIVCSYTADVMFKFMAKFQFEILVNAETRSQLAENGGLCSLHTWQYSGIASPQGISGSYFKVLMTLSRKLSALTESESLQVDGLHTKNLVTNAKKCRACREQQVTQERAIQKILDDFATQHEALGGALPVLCLPHLSLLLEKVSNLSLAKRLIAFESALFERLAENMERYALKHDALRRHLQSKDEEVAYHRALSQLVGDKRLNSPWQIEYIL